MPPPAELPPGAVTTRTTDAELIIRMSGEIDLSVQPQLSALADRLAGRDIRVVVDLAQVRFCDGTLAGFLAETLGGEPATVQAPSRLAREFLALYGLNHRVRTIG